MIDGISWWLYNGKDRGVPEKCFLQNGVQAAERIFQTRSQKRNNRTSDRSFTAEQKLWLKKETAGSGGLK